MNIETPAIFLSFDDGWIDEWHSSLSLLERYGVKATFYLSFGVIKNSPGRKFRPTSEQWKMLEEIESQGHTIGYHAWWHFFAYKLFKTETCEAYKKKEIYSGMELLEKHGFKPRHFAYPYGSFCKASHKCLLEIFDTLRVAVEHNFIKPYSLKSAREERIFDAIDISRDGVEEFLDKLCSEKKIGFLFGHNPKKDILELVLLFGIAKNNGIHFYPMSVLDKA